MKDRICFLKFYETSSVGVAQHISNTVFIDRALIVAPFNGCKYNVILLKKKVNYYFFSFLAELPDEFKGLEILNTLNGGLLEPKLPATLTNQVFK